MSALALGVPLTVVSVLGLLLNGYILLVVVLTKQVQTANNLLLLHLGVVDSLLCVVFLLFSAPTLLRGGATGAGAGAPAVSGGGVVAGAVTGPLCAIHGFLFTLLHPVALWTVCGLNCDRYYAISAPLHYTNLVNTRKVTTCLGAAWVLALTMALPPLFLGGPGYRYAEQGAAGCAPHFVAPAVPAPVVAVWYSAIYTIFTLLLPAALILGCNLKVLMIARYHRHRIASAIYEVTLSAQVTITHQRNPFYLQNQFRGRSAVYSVLQLLGSLLLLYFPYYGVIVWEAVASSVLGTTAPTVAPTPTLETTTTATITDTELSTTPVSATEEYQSSGHVHPHVVAIAFALLSCSPPINGFIYGVKSKVLRKTFANFWRKQMSKSEVNHEIQARTPSACGSRRPSLTPLGLLGRASPAGRRLSEVLLEPSGRYTLPTGCSPHRPRMLKRMATELSWRPALLAAATSVDLNARMRRSRSMRDTTDAMRHGVSCNTLQVPAIEAAPTLTVPDIVASPTPQQRTCSPPSTLRPSMSVASLLMHRVLQAPRALRSVTSPTSRTPPPQRRSPQILITRAFSQESSDPEIPATFTFRAESVDLEHRNNDQTCSSTAALLLETCSSPESPDPCEALNGTREEDSLEQRRRSHGKRVCISLDDVSGCTTSPTPSPTHQPSSLPVEVQQVAETPRVLQRTSWFRSLVSRASSSNLLMSWPLRAELRRKATDLAMAQSCSDVTAQPPHLI